LSVKLGIPSGKSVFIIGVDVSDELVVSREKGVGNMP
jgi:hypothetical protein